MLVLKKIYSFYAQFCNEDLDPRLQNLPFATSPIPVVIVIALYLWFVNGRGQKWMEGRKALTLTKLMNGYNIFQVIANIYVFYKIFMDAQKVQNFRFFCIPEPKYDYSKEGDTFVQVSYLFYILKLVDLFDTVFFILRKKNNQVTFLHIYHHAGIVVVFYVYLKLFSGGGNGTIYAFLNSLMHAIMYGYYFLTSYKPNLKPSLWWKKYITQLQMLQFVCFLVYTVIVLFVVECKNSKTFAWVGLLQSVVLLALFSDFYIKAYLKKKV